MLKNIYFSNSTICTVNHTTILKNSKVMSSDEEMYSDDELYSGDGENDSSQGLSEDEINDSGHVMSDESDIEDDESGSDDGNGHKLVVESRYYYYSVLW